METAVSQSIFQPFGIHDRIGCILIVLIVDAVLFVCMLLCNDGYGNTLDGKTLIFVARFFLHVGFEIKL